MRFCTFQAKYRAIQFTCSKLAICLNFIFLFRISPVQAYTVWIYGGNTVSALEAATGQSSGGIGQAVDWKDGVFKPTRGFQAGGERAEIGVIQRQSIPPLEAHAMLSINDVFGTGGNRPLPSSVMDEAWLWVYVAQANGAQTVTVRGLKPGDRDWLESEASYALKINSSATEWSSGVLRDSFLKTYGAFQNPSGAGWFKIPVNLAEAVMDYRDGAIGGIVLEASAQPANDIGNFYFYSDNHAAADLRPGLFLVYHEADTMPQLEDQTLASAADGSIQAQGAGRVTVNGQDAAFDFGGTWRFAVQPLEAGQSEIVEVVAFNEQGQNTRSILHAADFVAIQAIDLASTRIGVGWQGSATRRYTVQSSPQLVQPGWTNLSGCDFLTGTEGPMSAQDESLLPAGFYRVKETQWELLP